MRTRHSFTSIAFALGLLCITLTLMSVLSSCKDTADKTAQLEAERDSLRVKSDSATKRLQMVEFTMATINATLDSIAFEENIVFVDKESGANLTRTDALRNLEHFETIVRKQRERINELERTIQQDTTSTHLRRLLAHMKNQLDAKDAQIASLRADLNDKNVSISQLRKRVKGQSQKLRQHEETIAELDKRNAAQTEAIMRQNDALNHAFVLIATKKELKARGLLKRRKLVSDALPNASGLNRIDIRAWREVTFTAKRPRILTSMPTSSYELIDGGNHNYTLRIADPTAFWSVSNYLVIQTD